MDLLTQGLLGSAVAQSGAKKNEIKIATFIGFLAGLLADMDVLIRSSTDPLLTIEYHRHFTHSIFFIPFGALIASLVLFPFIRIKLSFPRLYYFCFLGYLLSGTLDLFTSYGTYWLWPLLDERLALHVIGIVDIFFTPILLVTVIGCFSFSKSRIAHIGLIICSLYLMLGYVQLQRATNTAVSLAQQRGHVPGRLLVKPSPLTLFLWRSIYQYKNTYFIDAIHVSWKTKVYIGDKIDAYPVEESLLVYAPDTVMANDIRRFVKFSDGYVSSSPDNEYIIGDMRYSLLPNSIKPLWGIQIDPYMLNKHATYRFFRKNNNEERNIFLKMVLGREI